MRTPSLAIYTTLCVLAPAGMAQQLTPREIFFAATKPAAAAVTPQAARPAVPKAPSAPAIATVRPPAAPEKTPVAVEQPSVPVVNAAYTGANARLGLRYSILHSRGEDGFQEIDPKATFRSGDRIKLSLQSNEEAYLYVVTRGSSGIWQVLFPSAQFAGGSNLVKPLQTLTIPEKGRFYFDDQAGTEQLFIVLSRKPEADFEQLIYSLSTPGAPKPASAPAAPKPAKTLQLSAMARPIDDALVGHVRSTLMARDLVFEAVDSKPPGESATKAEKAIYVVNQKAGPDGKVIVDLKLEHK